MKKNIITNNWRDEVKEDFANAIVEAKLDEKLRDKLLLSVKNLMRVGNISLTDTDLHNLINTLQSQIDVLKEEQETQADLMQRNRASGVVFSVATETTAGMVKIATDDDLVNGVNAVSMVTPKNLKTYLAKTGGGGTGVAVLDATETTKGISEIATQAEVNAGTDDSKIVTPKKIKPLIDDLKNDTTALENSTKAKAAELGRVDDGLRKDVDTNVNDIAQLKAKETADIKGVVDQIAKLKNTDTDGLTKAISDLAKKEKSDIAGIKTQQQTNTTAINDLKNKTVTLIDASETTKGISEIATQAEVNAGTDDNKIVTPKKIKPLIDDLKNDTTALENSTKAKAAELGRVDDGLRKDVDTNINDIAQLKAKETADIKGVVDQIAKLKNTDTDGLTKAISDLAKKEKSDIAGIKTQQQTNTTAINDLKNKTVTLIDASESTKGVAEIATQQEANDGNDDSRIVTPKKLKVITSDLDRRSTRIRNDVDRNTADLVTHRTDIQQNTTDIVSNTASIATIINTIKKEITTGKLAESFTVPSVLHDKIQLDGEENTGNYGYSVAMNYYHLAIADTVNQEVVIYHRNDNNKKLWELEDVHKGKKHGDVFVEDGQVYAKRKDGVHLDVFEYDETQTNLTFKKVSTITLTDTYGKSLAVNDDYLIVGNPQAKTVLVYKHSGIKWQLVKQLSGGDSFGGSVAVTDKNIIIAEPDNKKIEIFDLNYNKVKTLTGGASFGKLIDLTDDLSAFAEPDNNILKIYKNLAEIASKTVKADCVSVGTGIVLATSKTDKKAYIYDFFSKTGWFTTTRTKWNGLPDNTQGYTGYNIAGGQTQLVKLTGTTDTYTKYKGGAWVKNGKWGGVLRYSGSKIGFEKLIAGTGKITITDSRAMEGGFGFVDASGQSWVGIWYTGVGRLNTITGKITITDNTNVWGGFGFLDTSGQWWVGTKTAGIGRFNTNTGKITITDSTDVQWGFGFVDASGQWWVGTASAGIGRFNTNTGKITITDNTNVWGGFGFLDTSGQWWVGTKTAGIGRFNTNTGKITITDSTDVRQGIGFLDTSGQSWVGTRYTGMGRLNTITGKITITDSRAMEGGFSFVDASGQWWVGTASAGIGRFNTNTGKITITDSTNVLYGFGFLDASGQWWVGTATNGFGRLDTVAKKQLYLETTDGKHYYDNKELKDETKFDSVMQDVAPLPTLPDPIPQANRNVKFTLNDIQEQPNKTGNYVSLLGTGTATIAKSIDDTNFTIGSNYGDACAITTDKILITNKTDSKLAVYDFKGKKLKEVQLTAGLGSTIDATENEAVVGSETANTVDIVSLT